MATKMEHPRRLEFGDSIGGDGQIHVMVVSERGPVQCDRYA